MSEFVGQQWYDPKKSTFHLDGHGHSISVEARVLLQAFAFRLSSENWDPVSARSTIAKRLAVRMINFLSEAPPGFRFDAQTIQLPKKMQSGGVANESENSSPRRRSLPERLAGELPSGFECNEVNSQDGVIYRLCNLTADEAWHDACPTHGYESRTELAGCSQSNTCLGRCGGGCGGDGEGIYTKDCAEHDSCCREHGGCFNPGDALCGDEYAEAADDFFSNSNCPGGCGGGGGDDDPPDEQDPGEGGGGGGGGPGDDPPPCYPWPQCSPIVIDLLGDGFRFTNAEDGIDFDIMRVDRLVRLAWTMPGYDDTFLALDRNSNGAIDDGGELFGNFTDQPETNEPNGYNALALFDTAPFGGNEDGKIGGHDGIYGMLVVWHDRNHSGMSESGELYSLEETGIDAIYLDYWRSSDRDEHGNQLRYFGRVCLSARRDTLTGWLTSEQVASDDDEGAWSVLDPMRLRDGSVPVAVRNTECAGEIVQSTDVFFVSDGWSDRRQQR